MSLIERMRKQRAVYWPPKSPDAFGKPQFEAPEEIKCRWEDITEDFIGQDEVRVFIAARVYVDRDVIPGGVLCLGLLDSILHFAKPFENLGASEIAKFDKIPKLNGKKFLRIALLRSAIRNR